MVTYIANVYYIICFCIRQTYELIELLFPFPTDCPLKITTDDLPPRLGCYIPSSCTAVYCCLNATVPFRRSLSAFLDIDPCNQRLLIGIENFIHSISLYDIVFGTCLVFIIFIKNNFRYECQIVIRFIVHYKSLKQTENNFMW